MSVNFEVGPYATAKDLKLKRFEFIDRLMQIPLNLYSLKTSELPKKLLKTTNLMVYRKFLCALLVKPSMASIFSLWEIGYMTDECRRLGMSKWVVSIREAKYHKDQKVNVEESEAKLAELNEWLDAARSILEIEFMHAVLSDNDLGAREVLQKRFGKHWDSKIMLAELQAEQQQALLEKAKQEGNAFNVTFKLAGD